MGKNNRHAQLTIFVIIGLVIIAVIIGYFLVKQGIFKSEVPSAFVPVYDYYTSCVEGIVFEGAKIAGEQGGYLNLPKFEPGSSYSPFSSQFDFFGQAIPYWYYVSGNGVMKEQVPSQDEVEIGLGDFIKDELTNGRCSFDSFVSQGYEIELGEPTVDVSIEEDKILVNLNQEMVISRDGERFITKHYNLEVDSMLGSFYEIAKGIYDYEQKELFLEKYAKDILFLYVPVAGSEFGCDELFWKPEEVFKTLKEAAIVNIGNLKINGEYYNVGDRDKYFVVDPGFKLKKEQVNFLYDGDWPFRFEVWPTEGGIMKSEQMGPNQGLGFIGFCYNTYKFVYDWYFPVLVQIMDSEGNEIFQFPIAVVINKNEVREAMDGESLEGFDDICENTNSKIDVYTYNDKLEGVEAEIKFECLTSSCSLGKTTMEGDEAELNVGVPACVNGEIVANVEGYAEKRVRVNTNEVSFVDIQMEKEHALEVEVYVDGILSKDPAMIYFVGDSSKSLVYPQENKVVLNEDQYEITAYIMKNTPITLPAKVVTQCTEAKDGFKGLLGFESEKCFDVQIPSMVMDHVFYAGGSEKFYAVESELEESDKIKIYASSFDVPESYEELQKTFDLIDGGDLDVQMS